MSTTTPRLSLIKPDTADMMNIGAEVLSTNYTTIDGACGCPTYTVATRPSSPWVGRTIFESDTGNCTYWDGTAWRFWGHKDKQADFKNGVQSAQLSAVGNTELVQQSITFLGIPNRRFRIDFVSFVEAENLNVNDRFIIQIRWALGATVTSAGTSIYSRDVCSDGAGSAGTTIRGFAELDYTGAQQNITVGITFKNSQATATQWVIDGNTDGEDVQGYLSVRDIGVH